MRFGVIVFPGSNCDDDMVHVLGTVMGQEVVKVWHKTEDLSSLGHFDCLVIPGGFSYGDYLRSGAIARFSPVMQEVVRFAEKGGYVFGICNGFQVLCEAGLLPGVLMRNEKQLFICDNIHLRTESSNSFFSNKLKKDQVLKIPIAHADGRYFAKEDTLKQIIQNDQIIFKYCDKDGNLSAESNINGSLESIAGICNESRNVFGMMPHPERASEDILGNTDGLYMFESLIEGGLVKA